MKFTKTKTEGKSVADKTTVIYNARITIHEIPLAAYDYVVNGKPALEPSQREDGNASQKRRSPEALRLHA